MQCLCCACTSRERVEAFETVGPYGGAHASVARVAAAVACGGARKEAHCWEPAAQGAAGYQAALMGVPPDLAIAFLGCLL